MSFLPAASVNMSTVVNLHEAVDAEDMIGEAGDMRRSGTLMRLWSLVCGINIALVLALPTPQIDNLLDSNMWPTSRELIDSHSA